MVCTMLQTTVGSAILGRERSMGGSADDGQSPWASCPFLTAPRHTQGEAAFYNSTEFCVRDLCNPVSRINMSLYSDSQLASMALLVYYCCPFNILIFSYLLLLFHCYKIQRQAKQRNKSNATLSLETQVIYVAFCGISRGMRDYPQLKPYYQ